MKYGLIPVFASSDSKNTQPTQDESGLYVVNQSALNGAPANKFYLYNPNTGKYYYLNEQTASEDLIKEANAYEQTLNNISHKASAYADTTNPTQVNSFADLASMFLTGDLKSLYYGVPNYLHNMVVRPMFDKDLKGQRAGALVNNLLVNLGETMDFLTLSNLVKGATQGQDPLAGYFWNVNGAGRTQYDYDTGHMGKDFLLELISDPTNWITLGGKAAVKEVVTSAIDDVATNMGLTVNKNYVKTITKSLTSEVGTAYTLKEIDYSILFNLPKNVDPTVITDINKLFNNVVEAGNATKKIKLVNSVMGTSDYYEKAAFKTAMMSSALGLEAMAVKGGAKHILSWVNGKMSNILKYHGASGEYKWSDYVEIYREAEDIGTVHNLLTRSYENTSKEYADSVTSKIRTDILRNIQDVVDANKKNIKEAVSKLDELAREKGFSGLNDMYQFFDTVLKEFDGNVAPIVRKIESIFKELHVKNNHDKMEFLNNVDSVIKNTVRPIEDFDLEKEYTYNPLKDVDRTLEALEAIQTNLNENGLLVNEGLFESVKEAFKISTSLESVQRMIAMLFNTAVYTPELVISLFADIDKITKLLIGTHAPSELVIALSDLQEFAIRVNNTTLYSDEVFGLLEHAIDTITSLNGNKLRMLYQEHLAKADLVSSILFRYRDSLADEIDDVASIIDLSGHKVAPILKELRAKDNMLASSALRNQLDNAKSSSAKVPGSTADAFIHPMDFNMLSKAVLNVPLNRVIPQGYADFVELKQALIDILEKHNLYGAEEDVSFLNKIFEDNKAHTDLIDLSVSEVEDLITLLRRRAKSLVNKAAEEAVERTVEKEIPKEFVKKVWSKEWTEEYFRVRTGVEYSKIYKNVDNDKWYVKVTSKPAMTASTVVDAKLFEDISDNLADYIDALCIEQYGKMFVDAKQLYSKIYAIKLSQAESLRLILNDDSVTGLLNSILDCKGVGAFIRTLEQYEDTAHAAEVLHSLAVSTQVHGDILKGLRKSISDEWVDAIDDALAGMMRMHISNIRLDDLTIDVLEDARTFINKSNSYMGKTNKYILDEYLPEKQADVLADVLFNKAHLSKMSGKQRKFYDKLIGKLEQSNEYNVVFSIGQHSKRGGVFEFVCELPDEVPGYGKKVHFVCDATDYKSHFADPLYCSEILGQDRPVPITGVYAPNAVHLQTSDEFAAYVNNFLEALKTHVNPPESKNFRDIQFIGYGNSNNYNKQDKVLREFFGMNKINFSLNNHLSSRRNAKCVDIKELIHTNNGAAVITEDLYESVKNVLAVGKDTLDSWNNKAQSSHATVVPDLSKGVLNAIDELTAQVNVAYSIKVDMRNGRTVADVSGTTASLLEYSEEVLKDLRGTLNNFSVSLSNNLRSIRYTNSTMAGELIVGDIFNKLTGEPNIMKYLTKYLVDNSNGGLPSIALKMYHNPDLVRAWFDLETFADRHVLDLLKANELLRRLQNTVENIKQSHLLYSDSSLAASDEVLETLRSVLDKYSNSVTVRRNLKSISEMHKGLTPEQTYAVAVYYMSEFRRLPENVKEAVHEELVTKWVDNIDANRYWGFVDKAEDTVLSREGLYNPEIDSFKSMKFDESYNIKRALDTQKEITKSKENVECFKDTLKLDDETMSKNGVNNIVFKMQRDMIDAYTRFIDCVTGAFDNARATFLGYFRGTDDVVKQYEHKKIYTEEIKFIQSQVDELAQYHTYHRIYSALNMPLDMYEQYLFKYSQGVQVFDSNSEVLRSDTFLNDFIKRIESIKSDTNKTSIRVAQTNKYTILYIDKSAVDETYFENLKNTMLGYGKDRDYTPGKVLHFDYSVENILPKELKEKLEQNAFFKEYVEFQKAIERTHDVAYSMSTHRAMNVGKLKELYEVLPDEVVNKMYSVDYWASLGLVQGGLVHNIVGDYNNSLGGVFTTYSSNIVTNINSGVAKLYRQNVSREGYVSFFASKYNSLKSRLDMFRSIFDRHISAEEVNSSIKEMGYKIVSFTGDKGAELKLHDVSTERGLRQALREEAIIVDNSVYDTLFRTIMDNSLPTVFTKNKVFNYITECTLSFMHLLKLGQLQSVGWVLRNIQDSTTKGAIASNANMVEYMSMIPTVTKKLKAFDTLVRRIYSEQGSLTPASANTFFRSNPNVVDEYGMTLEQFLEYLDFSNNSASVPTPAQMSIFSNMEQKLLNMFSTESGINKGHITALLNAYVKKKGNRINTEQALKGIYSEGTVKVLMNVFDRIPKGYSKVRDTNVFSKMATWLTDYSPLTKWNNTVERMERFLAYDYNRMMGKTTGASIDIVNKSQFNRAYDSIPKKVFEAMLPFSSFQVDNMMFWLNALSESSGSTVGVLVDYLQTRHDEDELTPEEIATNASIRYMFLQGNIMLDDDGSLTLKVSDSLSNTMQILADPIGYFKDAFNVPMEKVIEFIRACTQDEEEYKADPYNKVMPISLWLDWEYKESVIQSGKEYENGLHSFAVDLIPVIGAWWLRAQTAWTDPKTDPLDIWLRRAVPSLFGKVKPVGLDWYGENNNEAYHKMHTYVVGISHLPAWLDTKDPKTYANTIERLVALGYSRELATTMVVDWGYYMKAPDYVLKQFKEGEYDNKYTPKVHPKNNYVKKTYAPYPIRTKKVYAKKAYTKSFNMVNGGDRYRTTRFGVARIYRLTSMYDRITKSGTSRMTMMLGRGHGASSIRVVRDRIKNNTIRRQRQRRILHM